MKEKLRQLADSVPEVESMAIVDEEGFIVYKYDKPELDMDSEELSVQIINPLNRLMEAIGEVSHEEDTLEELVFFTDKHILLVYKLVNDTFLVVLSKRDPLYGKTRFKVLSKLNEIKSAL